MSILINIDQKLFCNFNYTLVSQRIRKHAYIGMDTKKKKRGKSKISLYRVLK